MTQENKTRVIVLGLGRINLASLAAALMTEERNIGVVLASEGNHSLPEHAIAALNDRTVDMVIVHRPKDISFDTLPDFDKVDFQSLLKLLKPNFQNPRGGERASWRKQKNRRKNAKFSTTSKISKARLRR